MTKGRWSDIYDQRPFSSISYIYALGLNSHLAYLFFDVEVLRIDAPFNVVLRKATNTWSH